MKKNKYLSIFLLLFFVLLSTKVYAVQDSIWASTAKGVWEPVREQLKWYLGVNSPTLFKAYPEKEIDANDTVLCVKTINQFGGESVFWNGMAYKWVFECRVPELSKDSMYKVTVYLKLLNPVFIKKETIYKPITEYADTVGIAEDSWFDSDSLYKIPLVAQWEFLPNVFLERGISFFPAYPIKEVMWNMVNMGSDAPVSFLCINARTGKIIEKGVVSVSEPTISDGITISPNPTSTSFSISGIDGVTSVKILTSLGMKVKQLSMVNGQLSIDVSDLASGVYFVQFRSQTGVVSKPIVVSR